MKTPTTQYEYVQSFFWWIRERHRMFEARYISNEPPPWTDDPILSQYKFTNPFRQNDRVTLYLTKVKSTLAYDSLPKQFWLIVLFRLFNWPPTFEILAEFARKETWNTAVAKRLLHKRKAAGHKVFTGAYMVNNAGTRTDPKIDIFCEALEEVYKDRAKLLIRIMNGNTLQNAVAELIQYTTIGPFTAYEIATDLRHTGILSRAADIMTWANPGPGAQRGCNRIFSPSHGCRDKSRVEKYSKDEKYQREMQILLKLSVDTLPPNFPRLEMRDIEHSLCEFDKYCRVMFGEGRPRSMFKPSSEPLVGLKRRI